jgi:excisionase family DNA binding protein
MPNNPALLTTTEAASRLGITPRRVRALIAAGRLAATRIGRDWLVADDALASIATRKPGRPRSA